MISLYKSLKGGFFGVKVGFGVWGLGSGVRNAEINP